MLISPINVLAAVIAPKIDELLHSDEYIGASDAYLANADIQADDLEYYPETADRTEEDAYYYSLDSENAACPRIFKDTYFRKSLKTLLSFIVSS